MRFIFPIDGDFLNVYDGVETKDGLEIEVLVESGEQAYINGVKADFIDGKYVAKVKLKEGANEIIAKSNAKEINAVVYYQKNTVKKFRISSDDNIIFLQDITKNKDKYKSIFENPYLEVYKKAHDLYGAKVHLNLFYEFDDKARSYFSDDREYFNLSMATDKFKDEFIKNSDWLKLSFHADKEFPDKPYENATAEKITADYIKVVKEIERFAGKETLSTETTTVHWGEANVDCAKALSKLGIKNLAAYFDPDENGEYIVSYYLKHDQELCRHLHNRDFWRDNEKGLTFAKIDWVTNIGDIDLVMDKIKSASLNNHTGGFVSFMIHEQYFHKDYINYKPDFEDRVLLPAKYLFENGYKGALLSEIIK